MPEVTALIRHNATLLVREPGPLLSRMILPLAFLLALRPLYTAAQGTIGGTTQAVLGALITFSLLAMSIVGASMLNERVWHTWNRLRATTLRPAQILAGKGIPALGALLAQQAVVLVFGVLVLGMRVASPALLVISLLAWTLLLLALGATLGVFAGSYGALSASYDVGGLVLSSLGGALVPISAMPGWLATIAPVSPGYWAVTALRGATTGDAAAAWRGSAVLLAFAAAAALLAGWRISRGWGRSAKL
ncbi:ABC transporter permease [Amycolatopsis acidicola]|uniref:Transport permease protein n=1 Tax=Amycolatopsis acidicola TaxID=2596893 RepID=A0A5N0V1Y0_9PSEU|nr:ABC transporter permease [Amycolatopsis acidicola]KAA9158585.1 ABC transporter permease [Amycolatopsis acidicola]